MIGVKPGNFVSRHQRQIDEVAVYQRQASTVPAGIKFTDNR